jgi:hypothetical protein
VPFRKKSTYAAATFALVRQRSCNASCSFDLDMPVDCDDEYWEPDDPTQAFKQPPGRPSRIAAFIYSLKLTQILGYALRTIVRAPPAFAPAPRS